MINKKYPLAKEDETESAEKNFLDAKTFLSLPKEDRKNLLRKQADSVKELYLTGSDLTEWTEDYIDELEGLDD